MRKVIESCGLAIVIFIFMLVLCDITLDYFKAITLVDFVIRGLKIIFAVAGFFLVSHNLYAMINNRVSIMATCYMLTSVLVLVNLIVCIVVGRGIELTALYGKNNFLIDFLEIIFLVLCMKWDNEKDNIRYWIIGAVSLTLLSIVISFMSLPIDYIFETPSLNKQVERVVALVFISILSIGWVISRKRHKTLSRIEQHIYTLLCLNKLLVGGITIVISMHYSIILHIVLYLLNLLFYITIFAYIDETTLTGAWKKIEINVSDKEKEVNRIQVEKRILVASAKDVQKRIEQIHMKIEELERKIIMENKLQELEYVQKIDKNCNRLIKLSRNIVAINAYERGKVKSHFEKVDMVLLVGDIVSSIAPYLEEKELTLQYLVDSKAVICDVEREAIERILLNLISNSVKYNHKGGNIKVFLFAKKELVYLVVQDTGVGIPQHLLSTVFRRFSRVESNLVRQQEGSGLGLTIVKSLVEIHHGEIEINSKLNKGTSISIILPMEQPDKDHLTTEVDSNQEELYKKVQIEFSDIGV